MTAAHGADVSDGAIDLCERSFGMFYERNSSLGECHTRFAAQEKARAEAVFETSDLPTDCRLANAKTRGGLTETSHSCRSHDIVDVPKLDRLRLSKHDYYGVASAGIKTASIGASRYFS